MGRGLAPRTHPHPQVDFVRVVRREIAVGLICATLLTLIGFLRVYVFTAGSGGMLPVAPNPNPPSSNLVSGLLNKANLWWVQSPSTSFIG